MSDPLARLARAAHDLLKAYGGDFPDHILGAAAALADELAAIHAEPIGPHIAAIEHMRCAERYAREIGSPRLFEHVRAAVVAVERAAGRQVLPYNAEVEREAQRLAELPDPAPARGEK